jgi:flagella basal body P-ring formation protein FlgA
MRTSRTILSLCSLAGALLCHAAAHAELAVLHTSARVAPGAAVTLADIAKLDEAAVRKFGAIRIAEARDAAFEITRATIEERLAEAGADTAELRISGERVVVRPLRGAVAKPEAATAVEAAPASRNVGSSIDPAAYAGQGTPLGVVSELLRNAFGAEGDRLRLHIEAEDLARLAPTPGLRHEISARSALRSDHVSFEIVALDGDEVVSRRRVKVSPRIATDALVAPTTLRRGTPISASDVRVEERELEPSQAARAATSDSLDAMKGAKLARGIDAGVVISTDDLQVTALVRRNDRVIVRREVGAVAIEIEAIALEDGAVGEMIALQRVGNTRKRGARDSESRAITAEVTDSGRAVIR